MQIIEYRTMDKSSWPVGPWQDEPDKKQWPDQATGLPCLIVRNSLGALCGYVGVAEGHPLFEKHYDETDLECHGGPTFSSFCHPGAEESNICHRPDPGEPDHVWWFGFDCAHCDDLIPNMRTRVFRGDVYRDFRYVEAQCVKLAGQLAQQARPGL
jgi:hypothetical protein